MGHLSAAAALLGIGIAWGLTVPLVKIAVSSGHHPLGLIVWQLAFGAVLLGLLSVRRRRWPRLDARLLAYLAGVAVLGTVVPNSFGFLAASQLPAGVMAIVIASVPMFTWALALGLRIEGFAAVRLVGVALGAAAVAVLVVPETSLPDPAKAVFVLVALVAPACYGAEAAYIALRAPPGLDAAATLLGASVAGLVIAAPLALAAGVTVNLARPWGAPEWALLGSTVCHVGAYTGYIWLVGAAGPVFSSQVAYVVTLSGVAASALVLGESYSAWVWLALALMIAGLTLVQPRAARRALPVGET